MQQNHCDAACWSWGVSSVPVCRRVVHTRKISSPKLDSQFLQRVLPLIWNGLSPLQNISEFLQALQRVSQLPPHHLELVLQHLDPLDGEELVSLGTVERLFQVYRWDEEKKKLRDEESNSLEFLIIRAGGRIKHKLHHPPRLVLLSSSVFIRCRFSSMRLIWEVLLLMSLLRRCSSSSLLSSSPWHFAMSEATWLHST